MIIIPSLFNFSIWPSIILQSEYYIKKYLLYKNKYLDLKGGAKILINDKITFCIYINLDHRTDRKEHIENLLNKTDFR